ncbi:hypothetical protein NSPZN2_60025 [Nitrospira defluvii]|uniref:Uncharacterized protein n=1 Tax=Nitrospira defluvii TaxID=330214 RepID=A0ABM8S6F8_9BACT|nr:hypothetical protein NSPZN2_60025 [Nitrospira defluvii]
MHQMATIATFLQYNPYWYSFTRKSLIHVSLFETLPLSERHSAGLPPDRLRRPQCQDDLHA